MSDRFFLEAPITEQTTELQGEQAHHAIHVMRQGLGDALTLFDGRGTRHIAEITEIKKKLVRLRVLSSHFQDLEDSPTLTLATAIPKGDRQRFLVEKMVELGVQRWVPLRAKRSVAVASENAIERFQKWVIEACKQCRRDYLMEVSGEETVAGLLGAVSSQPGWAKLVALPDAAQSLASWQPPSAANVMVVIGPEGGLDDQEVAELLAGGWQPVNLGSLILRTETAALAAATLLRAKIDTASA